MICELVPFIFRVRPSFNRDEHVGPQRGAREAPHQLELESGGSRALVVDNTVGGGWSSISAISTVNACVINARRARCTAAQAAACASHHAVVASNCVGVAVLTGVFRRRGTSSKCC